jgi:hypothetical protein
MMIITLIMGHRCKRRTISGESAGWWRKERVLVCIHTHTHTHTHTHEDSIMRPTKYCLKKARRREGG